MKLYQDLGLRAPAMCSWPLVLFHPQKIQSKISSWTPFFTHQLAIGTWASFSSSHSSPFNIIFSTRTPEPLPFPDRWLKPRNLQIRVPSAVPSEAPVRFKVSPHFCPTSYTLYEVADGNRGITRVHDPFLMHNLQREVWQVLNNPDKFRNRFISLGLTFFLT